MQILTLKHCSSFLHKVACIFLIIFPFPGIIHAQQVFDEKILQRITAATFEVVVEKPPDKGIVYEKPLPLDLLPYHLRTSNYISIGTAFAISETDFVSAAHIFDLIREHLYHKFYLKNAQGRVFAIDSVKKYSFSRDLIVFSIKKEQPSVPFFKTNTRPVMNRPVFSVGNAYGQGIVIRDGLYTSNTPEEGKGAWNWLRFSAAASPGNSGGPLLDQAGKVIGVIVQRSRNENLNVALPISEVLNASEKKADCESTIFCGIEIMPGLHHKKFFFQTSLPKKFEELGKELVKHNRRIGAILEKEYKNKYRKEIFPNGKSSLDLLYSPRYSCFPKQISRRENGKWRSLSPKNIEKSGIDHNGSIRFGTLGNTTYFRIKKPDNIGYRTFLNDSKVFMDTLLKGFPITRNIGPEKIRIVSLGKAEEDWLYTDNYQRIWHVRTWQMPFSDTGIATYSLPVPGGNVVMLKSVNHGLLFSAMQDLRIMADFFYPAYCGTLRQWREFLQLGKQLPGNFSRISVDFQYDHFFTLRSPRFTFSHDNDILSVTPASRLDMYFTYFKDNGKVVWDISRVLVSNNSDYHEYFNLRRHVHPIPGLNPEKQKEWNKMTRREGRYNAKAYADEKGRTGIQTVISTSGSGDLAGKNQIYTLYYGIYEKKDNVFMKKRLTEFLPAISIME